MQYLLLWPGELNLNDSILIICVAVALPLFALVLYDNEMLGNKVIVTDKQTTEHADVVHTMSLNLSFY